MVMNRPSVVQHLQKEGYVLNGISGEGETKNAEREQVKVFQQRGMVVVVVSESDLSKVADGANFIAILRSKYEAVRLDLRARGD
jgi:hypothetical protein